MECGGSNGGDESFHNFIYNAAMVYATDEVEGALVGEAFKYGKGLTAGGIAKTGGQLALRTTRMRHSG